MVLELRTVDTGYGKKQVLFGLSLSVRDGEIVAIIGPNGAGKSTVLKAIFGLLPAWRGEVLFQGALLRYASPAENASRGLTFAPQGHRVFPSLSVMENIEAGGYHLPKQAARRRAAEVLDLFPVLRDRIRQSAGRLSGGEQQMLALARALVSQPRLLMLDEPSLGLSPSLVGTVFEKIIEISRESGVSILIVEQRVREVLDVCDRVYSLKLGEVAFEGVPEDLKRDDGKLKQLFF